jgi:uncharacterized protein
MMFKKPSKYLLLTFLISWISWWLLVLLTSTGIVNHRQGIFYVPYLLGGFGPTIAAVIVKKQSGEKDYKAFKKQLFKVKINLLWYLWVIFVPLLVYVLPWLIDSSVKGFTEGLFNQPVYMLLAMLPVMVIGGGLEELGWRGVLLPDLVKSTSKVMSTLIVGVIWTLWHIPLWFIKGVSQENFSFIGFAFSCIAISFLFTVIYLRTESIFMCVILHAFFNAYGAVLNISSINVTVDIISKVAVCVLIYMVHNWYDMHRNRGMATGVQSE